MERTGEKVDVLSVERLEVLSNWAATVRAACVTLRRAPACSLMTIAVTGKLQGGPGEAILLRGLSSELAERYGLQAAVNLEEAGFTVRFSRAAA
jgi:hypothetical protein